MAFIDYVVKEGEINSEGVFRIEEFIQHVREWLDKNGYLINEKVYVGLPGAKSDLKWECEKEYDDYNKSIIKLKIKLKAKEDTKGKKRLIKGKLRFVYEGLIKRDYDDKWAKRSRSFLREVYDKFIMEPRQKSVKTDLIKDIADLKSEVKQYLDI